ncbi:MAG: tetratricopeptide repeat protein [Gemmatimonadetes bacterium]|nr:tetratricopeptide repeat protein [Gemmatimonadota bacterium]
MRQRLPHRASALLTVVLIILPLSANGSAQEWCPAAGNPTTAEGWAALRAGELDLARGLFSRAVDRCEYHLGARIGTAYVALRGGEDEEARSRLETLLVVDPGNIDVLVGLGILAWRRGELSEVARFFSEVQALEPENATAGQYLERLPAHLRARPPRPDPDPEVEAGVPPALDPQGAGEAWDRGDTEEATRLYREILAVDPMDGVALHRLALMTAWENRYDEALGLFDRLLSSEPTNVDARVGRARVLAWRGDLDEAISVLEEILETHPGQAQALEARAQFRSWAGLHTAALADYEELVGVSQDPTGFLLAQARVLGSAKRLEESRAVYDSILALTPDNLAARMELARIVAFSGDFVEAEDRYREILLDHPENLEALRGLARTLTWSGHLPEGEEIWSAALDASPTDLVSRVGLIQNLRWQGRAGSAMRVAEGATEEERESPDLVEQIQWIRAFTGPRADASIIQEGDSDENSMTTARVTGRWSPRRNLIVRAEAYTRGLDQADIDLSRDSWGLNVSASYQVDPGWTFSGGAGGTRTDATENTSFTFLRAGVASPGRYRVGGALQFSRRPLDVTAQLVEQGIQLTMAEISSRWAPSSAWQISGSLGIGSYQGSEDNQRVHLTLQADRRMIGGWTLGLSHRYFRFDKDLDEFYFDPDYFGLTEMLARGLWQIGPWGFLIQLSPGAQKIYADGSLEASIRTSARVFYRFDPGREVSLSGGYSSAGLQSFNTGSSDYRYRALTMGISWVF